MTDRDTFAAAALTGLLAGRKFTDLNDAIVAETYAEVSFGLADAMLAVRGSRTADKTTHDAAPAARATADRYVRRAAADGDSDRTDKAAPRPSEGTGETPIDVEELLGELHYIAWGGYHVECDIRRTACEAEHAIDRLRAWVNELQLSRAEIDALQHVVEDGRFADLGDYGHLRSLLVRLRPEWEDEADRSQPVKDGDSDRSQPISDERLAALEKLAALDQELEEKHGLQGNPLIKAQRNNESI